MQCNNCRRILSCNCQTRQASNGVQVCAACVNEYEKKLKEEKEKVFQNVQLPQSGNNP